MKRLYIDVGNSRIKYVIDVDGVDMSGSCSLEHLGTDKPLFNAIDEIWCSYVGSLQRRTAVSEVLKRLSKKVNFAESVKLALSFQPAYRQPELMGVDRWLALLAVKDTDAAAPFIVVDAGTALTLDVLIRDKHLGGFILPGYKAQLNALVGQAALPDSEQLVHPSIALGQDTQEAMSNGVWLGLSSAIMDVCNRYPDAKMVVTGGDGKTLVALLNGYGCGEWRDNLVIDGLKTLSRGLVA